MEFIDLDLDITDESTLINVINNNIKVHSYYDKKISELKKADLWFTY